MASVHKVPVIDSRDEFSRFEDQRDFFIESAEEYAEAVIWYEEAVEEDKQGAARDVETFLRRVADSYREMELKKTELNDFIQGSSLRGHASYPNLGDDAIDYIERKTGAVLEDLQVEKPVEFYELVSDYTDLEGVEWCLETRPVHNMDQLEELVERSHRTEIESGVAGTEPEALEIDPNLFRRTINLYQKTGVAKLQEYAIPHEEYTLQKYGLSLLEQTLGMDLDSEILEEMDPEKPFTRASDLSQKL